LNRAAVDQMLSSDDVGIQLLAAYHLASQDQPFASRVIDEELGNMLKTPGMDAKRMLQVAFTGPMRSRLTNVLWLEPLRSKIMLQFRRAHEAHRDARLVFRAAAEGRPLEL